MPNIWIHLIFLVSGAMIGKVACRSDKTGVGLGIGMGVSLSFAIGFREPWYLLAGLLFVVLLLWRRTKVQA